jgi:hypothetical protein
MKKPKRNQLGGYSVSEFKTLLKLRGHQVPRNLYWSGYVTHYENRAYRWRYWGEDGFVVDISEPLDQFDRWSNSTEQTVGFSDWINNVNY